MNRELAPASTAESNIEKCLVHFLLRGVPEEALPLDCPVNDCKVSKTEISLSLGDHSIALTLPEGRSCLRYKGHLPEEESKEETPDFTG